MDTQREYDCVIVGGGLVGATLAIALSACQFSVALIEASERKADASPSFDDKALALSLSSVNIFKALGLWPEIEPGAQAIKRVHVSERGRFGKLRLDPALINRDVLGYVSTPRETGAVLSSALETCDRCDIYQPASLQKLSTNADQARVSILSGDDAVSLSTNLVIGADGGQSSVRALLGISASTESYGHSAVIAQVRPTQDHAGTAYERFTPDGPCALLPMRDGLAGLVLAAPQERLSEYISMSAAQFCALATDRSGGLLGDLELAGNRKNYPLELTRVDARHSTRAVLVGNAAHVIHPNAAQGMNLGLRDAAALLDALVTAREGSEDIGSESVLARWSADREADELRTVRFSDGLTRIFYHDHQPVAAMRHWGLFALERMPAAKRHCMQLGIGLAGRPPRLALGELPQVSA